MTKVRIGAVVIGVLGGAMWIGMPAAVADSGSVTSAYGYTHFNDGNNHSTVCDIRTDGVGVSGRISVRQGSGAWYHHKWHRDGTGNDGICAVAYEQINRESADMMLTICAQNGAGTVRYDCVSRVIEG